MFGVNALGIVVMAQVNGRLVGRVPPRTLLAWGLSLMALAGVGLLLVVLGGVGLVAVLPALFLLVSSLGLIVPNAMALALSNTKAAGSASGLLGVLQFSIGAVVAPLVGIAGSASAVPMAAFIAGFGIVAVATFLVLCRPARG